jgi:phage terminase small subunit
MSDQAASETAVASPETWEDLVKGRVRLFVLWYCTDDLCFLNGTAAYKQAYRKKIPDTEKYEDPTDEVAAASASRLLRNVKVKRAIQMLLKTTSDEADERGAQQLLKDWRTLAFYDPAKILTNDGKLKVKKLEDLGPLSICIKAIERTADRNGNIYTNIKLYDRRQIMQDYAKYLNLIRADLGDGMAIPVVLLNGKSDPAEWNKQHGNSESNPANGQQ